MKTPGFQGSAGLQDPRSSLDILLWSNSTRPDIALRQYTTEEVTQFLKEDQLTGAAKDVAARVTKMMESKPTQK